MSKDLIPNEKQLVLGINKAFDKMENTKKSYVQSVIVLGEKLIEAKKLVPHGHWEKFIKAHSEFAFDSRQAQKIMQIASHKFLVLEYFKGESSINGITLAISDSTEEQFKRAEELAAIEEQKQAEAKAERERKLAELASRNVEPEILEGEFVEIVKEVPVYDPVTDKDTEEYITQEQELDNIVEEVFSVNAKLQKENDYLVKVMGADDKLAAALEEIRILKILNTSLESSIDQKMNTIAAQTRQIQSLEKRIKKFLEVNNG